MNRTRVRRTIGRPSRRADCPLHPGNPTNNPVPCIQTTPLMYRTVENRLLVKGRAKGHNAVHTQGSLWPPQGCCYGVAITSARMGVAGTNRTAGRLSAEPVRAPKTMSGFLRRAVASALLPNAGAKCQPQARVECMRQPVHSARQCVGEEQDKMNGRRDHDVLDWTPQAGTETAWHTEEGGAGDRCLLGMGGDWRRRRSAWDQFGARHKCEAIRETQRQK